jgi:Cys-tRNA(Pro) deacylase
MANKEHISETPATQFLRKHKVAFSEHPYAYEDKGGTAVSARELGVDEHSVVKTLVMQDEAARPMIVLMHGDRKVSTKNLARAIPCKAVEPCKPEVAQRHSGYQIGGTSPFGTRRASSRCRRSTSMAAGAATWSASTRGCCRRCWGRRRSIARWKTDFAASRR